MKKNLIITKASGESATFSEKKLRASLERAGASDAQVTNILEEIAPKLYEGISTKKIYRIAFNLLKNSSRHLAAKYHLKSAIMELGPSGFPFERFVAEILQRQGYRVSVGQFVKGQCVQHEVDVIAQLDNKQLMIECKYHNLPGTFCDVKIPLYIQSRFKDVEAQWQKAPDKGIDTYQGCVVTNTRFSTDAIQYGICAGLNLIGWDFPVKGSLKDQIDTLGLYPITCLTSLTKVEKQRLLDLKLILCKDLLNKSSLLEEIGLKRPRIDTVLEETNQLCKHLTTINNTLTV